MRTTAMYDVSNKQFILNSPDFQAAKCWIVSLGTSATHMVVYAQLITPDKVNHGLHGFIVPVRNPETFIPYPGVEIVAMGEKIGVHGLDPGAIMFNVYRIPRENLLNKLADVTENGEYVTNIYNPNIMFALTLASLSRGRIIITGVSTSLLTKAVTIAIRNVAVHKQFNKQAHFEQNCRLLPYLATAYAFNIFSSTIFETLSNVTNNQPISEEMHAILSSCKPLCSWDAQRGIQECTEICSEYELFTGAVLQEIRKNHDVALTGEGDNHVVIQQTSNWLLTFWPLVTKNQKIITSLNSISFLNNAEEILNTNVLVTTVEDVINPKYILNTSQWLICYLLREIYNHIQEKSVGKMYKETLGIVYIQHFIMENMFRKISSTKDKKIQNVLLKLFSLYGVSCLLKHVSILYMGEYATGPFTARFIQDACLQLCADLENSSIALVDAIAPAESITYLSRNSSVYKHSRAAIIKILAKESGESQFISKL